MPSRITAAQRAQIDIDNKNELDQLRYHHGPVPYIHALLEGVVIINPRPHWRDTFADNFEGIIDMDGNAPQHLIVRHAPSGRNQFKMLIHAIDGYDGWTIDYV